jgi:hypothetical protein
MAIITLNNNSLSNVTALPAGVGGKVLQVVSTAKTNNFSTIATSDTAVTGLSLSITPSSSSNKIFVIFTGVTACQNTATYLGSISIYRDSTRIVGGQAGNTQAASGHTQSSLSILDTPSTTSAITYQLYAKSEGNSSAVYINQPSGVVLDEKAVITAYEIAG